MSLRSLGSGRPALPPGPAGLNFFPINGESLAVGQTAALISSTPSAQHKMFAGGVRPQYTAAAEADWYTSLVALKEQADAAPPWDTALRETPCAGAAEMISQLITAENGAPVAAAYTMLMSSPGYGGTPIASIAKGSTHFARLIQQCEYGYGLAGALTFATQAHALLNGANDYVTGTTRAAYSASLQALAADVASMCKGSRQEFAPPTLVAQVASHLYLPTATPSIALAQTDAATALPSLVKIAAPMYQIDYPSDWHVDTASSKWLGAYFGLAYKRIVYDGDTDWSGAMRIVSAVRNGDGIDVALDPIGALVLDTTWVTALADGNYGFQVVDAGAAPVAVTGVTITGDTTVRVACAAGGGAGSVLRYGWAGTAGETCPGRLTGARGNLRDSYGDTLTFEVDTGDVRPMHRWLRISEVATT